MSMVTEIMVSVLPMVMICNSPINALALNIFIEVNS